jgi:hypothetical protein
VQGRRARPVCGRVVTRRMPVVMPMFKFAVTTRTSKMVQRVQVVHCDTQPSIVFFDVADVPQRARRDRRNTHRPSQNT